MRRPVTTAKLQVFMERLGLSAKSPGVVYLTGGATALLLGVRDQTIDIDIKLDPEPEGAFEAIAELKNSLEVNVELASPDDFLPPLPGWKDRSPLIATFGKVEFRHFDFYSQALSKIERGHDKDLSDVQSLITKRLVDPNELERLAFSVVNDLFRYPAVDADEYLRKLKVFLDKHAGGQV